MADLRQGFKTHDSGAQLFECPGCGEVDSFALRLWDDGFELFCTECEECTPLPKAVNAPEVTPNEEN